MLSPRRAHRHDRRGLPAAAANPAIVLLERHGARCPGACRPLQKGGQAVPHDVDQVLSVSPLPDAARVREEVPRRDGPWPHAGGLCACVLYGFYQSCTIIEYEIETKTGRRTWAMRRLGTYCVMGSSSRIFPSVCSCARTSAVKFCLTVLGLEGVGVGRLGPNVSLGWWLASLGNRFVFCFVFTNTLARELPMGRMMLGAIGRVDPKSPTGPSRATP